MITTIDDEDLGPLKMQNLIFRMGNTPGSIRHGGRRLGQDTDSVLDELLGISGDKLDELRDERGASDGPQLPVRAWTQRETAGPGIPGRRRRGDARPGGRGPAGGKGDGPAMVAEVLLDQPAWVRVNAARTAWCEADLEAVGDQAFGIRIPKVESPAEVEWVIARAPGKPIICAIESARGVLAAQEIAAVPGVRFLAMGGVDLQRDLNTTGGNLQTLYARSHLVLASRAAGIEPPIDSVFPLLDDADGLRDQAEFARSLGFFGKSAIHPRQLPTLHQVFTPTAAEIDWAHAVLDGFDSGRRRWFRVAQWRVRRPTGRRSCPATAGDRRCAGDTAAAAGRRPTPMTGSAGGTTDDADGRADMTTRGPASGAGGGGCSSGGRRSSLPRRRSRCCSPCWGCRLRRCSAGW